MAVACSVGVHSHWSGCNFIPEDLHPKSFRASFGHNTNVWAVSERTGLAIGRPVGVFSLDQDLHEWFTRSSFGMAGRPCEHLQPSVQVGTRVLWLTGRRACLS
jgi:hypothetical protein